MTDPVLDDPGELLRFWLWWQKHHSVRSLNISNLARALGVKPSTANSWLRRHAIPSMYWNPIAREFGLPGYRAIEDDAKDLWAVVANRRGYPALHHLQVKRRAHVADVAPMHPETPGAAAAIAGSIDAATRSNRSRPPARRVTTRTARGKHVGA